MHILIKSQQRLQQQSIHPLLHNSFHSFGAQTDEYSRSVSSDDPTFPLSKEHCPAGPLICKVQSIRLLHSKYNSLFSLVLELQLPSVTCLHSRHQSYDDYLDASAHPLPHSFILLPGPAAHGSNLPLQHHLVTTAVIQDASSQINEGKEILPLLTFSLPTCNTTLGLWMVSQSYVLPLK